MVSAGFSLIAIDLTICKFFSHADMYARMMFIRHEAGNSSCDEVELPEPVPENTALGRGRKLLFDQLEVRSTGIVI